METKERLRRELEVLEGEERKAGDEFAERRSELERRLKEERTREERERQEEARLEHQKIAEKCYVVEVAIEEYMDKVLDGIDQLKELEGERNELAQKAGIGTNYDLRFEIIPEWLRARVAEHVPDISSLHPIYGQELFKLHRWSQRPEELAEE